MSSEQEHPRPPERGRTWSSNAPTRDDSRPRAPRAEGRAARKAPEERRAEITEAARALALADGLTAVTLRGVAARAGVTPALVAHYRPSMDELVAETFRTIVAAELREIAEAPTRTALGDPTAPGAADRAVASADTAASPAQSRVLTGDRDERASATDRLGHLVHTLLDGSRDDVTLVWVEAWAIGRRNETLAAAVREQMDAWHAVLHDLIAAGAADGEFEVDDPASVAWQLLGMIDGLNAQALVRWGEGRSVLLTHALEGMLGLERGALR
ncbi:TetR family transcriptional regulator C-terminal domain-containing protein [Agromyces silvae]|uniref:TetR family transcriptional regulator C-terminal domain-containing protein n=1 Tax=Agromyces silvae TaxID=3388266 RepID=UPI00280A7780|nr:TetR family transcriptional regulator C-terminal domain-containing protein [Agromyces protaetiae]